jgi:hypothetical protein
MFGAGIRTKELIVAIDHLHYTILRANLYFDMRTEAYQLAEASWKQRNIIFFEGFNPLSSR